MIGVWLAWVAALFAAFALQPNPPSRIEILELVLATGAFAALLAMYVAIAVLYVQDEHQKTTADLARSVKTLFMILKQKP